MFASFTAWLGTPLGTIIAAWVALGLATAIFKPRTPEAYASLASGNPRWFWPRLAALLQLAGGLGLDPMKVAEALLKLAKGNVVPLQDLTTTVARQPYRGPLAAKPDWDDTTPPAASPRDKRGIGPLALLAFVFASTIGPLAVVSSCTPGERQAAKSALDVLQVACIIANAESDDATVAQVCGIANDLMPDLEKILSAQRKATRKAACHPFRRDLLDGGSDAN